MLNTRSHSSLLWVTMLPPPLTPALLNNKWILSVWWRACTSSRNRSTCVRSATSAMCVVTRSPCGNPAASQSLCVSAKPVGETSHIATYGKARRIWLMDRGIPTEVVLAEMRGADPPVQYLVGTPKGRLTRLEKDLLAKPWQQARPGVRVKLLPRDGELYVFADSANRVAKERAMRRRQLKWLWARLKQLSMMALSREELLMKLGAARAHAPAAWRLVVIAVAPEGVTFTYHLDRNRLRRARRREGRYLLRTNLTEDDPAKLWNLYLLLVRVEEAFKNLKGDLAIRPIFHQDQARIEAHIFIAFLAYCLHATLARRLHALAPGLSPRSVIEKFAAMQMIDVHVPTTDGRELRLTRYTEPDAELRLLLDKLKLALPAQSPSKITPAQVAPQPPP